MTRYQPETIRCYYCGKRIDSWHRDMIGMCGDCILLSFDERQKVAEARKAKEQAKRRKP